MWGGQCKEFLGECQIANIQHESQVVECPALVHVEVSGDETEVADVPLLTEKCDDVRDDGIEQKEGENDGEGGHGLCG